MRMRNYLIVLLVAIPLVIVAIPALLVKYAPTFAPTPKPASPQVTPTTINVASQIPINVYRTATKTIETLPIESYIEGVVAAEMPAEFELEALKAQALAARTYIVRRLQERSFNDVPKGAVVLDTVQHQVFIDDKQQRERWGEQYAWKSKKIQQAVLATAGEVLTYGGKPIDATFFSTSNGYTENADEYWAEKIPYLKSVPSPWDSESPRYLQKTTIPLVEFEQKLGVRLDTPAMQGNSGRWYTVLSETTGKRVGKVRVGDKEFSGRELRERLGLNSTAFSMQLKSNGVEITTNGYGHGVGMSQWGANGMAKAGKSAEQIVKYFYQGIALENYGKMIKS